MKKLFFLLFIMSPHFIYSQVVIRANPMDCKVKYWIEEATNKLYSNSDIDSLEKTCQILISKDSIVGQDTVYLTFEKKLLSDVKKEEEDWRNNIIGKKLINFEMHDLNGKVINNEILRNKYIIADFSSFYCGPCIKEIPSFNSLADSLKAKGVAIIAFFNEDTVAMNQMLSNPVIVKQLLGGKKAQFSYTVIPDAKAMVDNYKIYAFPTHLIIDKKGIIRNAIVGVPHNDKTNKITVVKTMLAELKEVGF